MLFYIPLEPYETRYTADWVQQFEDEFKSLKVPFKTIFGASTPSKVSDGGVLNACGTNIYKVTQLSAILQEIGDGSVKDGDVIFFADLWFPGIESLFYVRDQVGIDFKVCGILHAGTWDRADFTNRYGMRRWAADIEKGWLSQFDMIFVATAFHKAIICMDGHKPDNIYITGLPFYGRALRDNTPTCDREDIVVFPHRCDPEKHPEMFDTMAVAFPKYKFVKTIECTKNRKEYFELLAKAKIMVSFADQETFGYSTLEAMALGVRVFVPDRLSYTETVPTECRYNSIGELYAKVHDEMEKTPMEYYYYPCIEYWEDSIWRMVSEMRGAHYGI
jgi:hypothetical protein